MSISARHLVLPLLAACSLLAVACGEDEGSEPPKAKSTKGRAEYRSAATAACEKTSATEEQLNAAPEPKDSAAAGAQVKKYETLVSDLRTELEQLDPAPADEDDHDQLLQQYEDLATAFGSLSAAFTNGTDPTEPLDAVKKAGEASDVTAKDLGLTACAD